MIESKEKENEPSSFPPSMGDQTHLYNSGKEKKGKKLANSLKIIWKKTSLAASLLKKKKERQKTKNKKNCKGKKKGKKRRKKKQNQKEKEREKKKKRKRKKKKEIEKEEEEKK